MTEQQYVEAIEAMPLEIVQFNFEELMCLALAIEEEEANQHCIMMKLSEQEEVAA